MKVSSFQKIITPELGVKLGGYGPDDISVAIHDDLMLSGICLDDGFRKVLLISYDLLGLDREYVCKIRRACAELIGGAESDVMLTCTHTHGGPHTRNNSRAKINHDYMKLVVSQTLEAVREIKDFTECSVYFHSGKCDANINRRITFSHNVCVQLSDRHDLEPLADGFRDQELGMLIFCDTETKLPVHILVNYAAHPLASHAKGRAGLTVTADYPGVLREIVKSETGAECTFICGAAGDMFPKDSEVGFEALAPMARQLARGVIHGLIDATRNPDNFRIANPILKTSCESFRAKFRKGNRIERYYPNQTEIDNEVQLLAIGDTVCLVGVPGELLAEVGQEIKWHSPYRKAFIMYNSTAYMSYICHGNAIIAGSYEAAVQPLEQRAGLKLLNCAVDGMYKLIDFPNEESTSDYK